MNNVIDEEAFREKLKGNRFVERSNSEHSKPIERASHFLGVST